MLNRDNIIMPVHQINVNPPDWQQSQSMLQDQLYIPTRISDHCHSSVSTLSSNHDICRICHCEGDNDAPLLAPCYCSGSLRYVHQTCLQQWIKASDTRICELCKFAFIMHSKTKPFTEWEKLQMSSREVRALWKVVVFNALTAFCVAWSLYILIERTIEEARTGFVDWGFWMKLVIVVIGSTGGIVFMYLQLKMYFKMFNRWRAYNRVIFIQNAPEKVVSRHSSIESNRDVIVPLKEPTNNLDSNHGLLSRNVGPSSTSESEKANEAEPPLQNVNHKLYIFDKIPSEDNFE